MEFHEISDEEWSLIELFLLQKLRLAGLELMIDLSLMESFMS